MGSLQVASGFASQSSIDGQSANLQESQSFALKVDHLQEVLRQHPDYSDGQPLNLRVRLSDGADWDLGIRSEASNDPAAPSYVTQTVLEIKQIGGELSRSFRYDDGILLRGVTGESCTGVSVTTENQYTLADHDALPVIAKMSENLSSIAAHVAEVNSRLNEEEQSVELEAVAEASPVTA